MARETSAKLTGDVERTGTVGGSPPDHTLGAARGLAHGATLWLVPAVVGVLVVGWAAVIFAFEQARFAVLAPGAQVGVEAASAFARLFGALVLSLFPADRSGRRLRWVAAGFVVLGLGGLVFGYLPSLLGLSDSLNRSTYESLSVRTLAGVLFVVGLMPWTPPVLSQRAVIIGIVASATCVVAVSAGADLLPPLVQITDLESAVARGDTPLRGLTVWHWLLSMVPLVLAILAVLGAGYQSRSGSLGGWLLVAMVLLAGSQLHNLFWPSIYSPVLATADILRLAFAAVVTVGGVLELRRIAGERAALLAVERAHSKRLGELAVLKADFTAMVAHELSSPLAAIRTYADLMATGKLGPEQRTEALRVIKGEAEMLGALVRDVQAAASVERADFSVEPRPVPVSTLLADAAAYARTLPGDHPILVSDHAPATVWADRERMGQVLRNLLSNAAKYSPEGTPIELRALEGTGCVRVEVADQGYGVHPDDVARVFEKFGRGRDQSGRKVAGVGLGLYLSRRIVQAHGSDLSLKSDLGTGSVFAFSLDIAR